MLSAGPGSHMQVTDTHAHTVTESADAEPEWRKTRLSLERPYKDDSGQPILTLLDITPDGQHVYEPREEWDAKLGQRFRRIFAERGIDFFERPPDARSLVDSKATLTSASSASSTPAQTKSNESTDADQESKDADPEAKLMTPEMLFKMRSEILPRLHVALGEMSQARDLLSVLLSASAQAPAGLDVTALAVKPSAIPAAPAHPTLPSGILSASLISPPAPILSVQAFNAQLRTGSKDDALRKASEVLRIAAEGIERSSTRAESYWANALRIRRANWGLITAPLPLGAPTGKGADKTSKDFFVSYGLEQSPALFRRKAIAHMTFYESASPDGSSLVFPHRDRTRLRVSISKKTPEGSVSTSLCRIQKYPEETPEAAIRGAQKEVVEQEIFDELIKEAGSLPTASARVSERLIVIDAAQGMELRLEMVDEDLVEVSNSQTGTTSDTLGTALCDLVSSSLPVLLLRQHAHTKAQRLGPSSASTSAASARISAPHILQPIINLLQYYSFLGRVKDELNKAIRHLADAGVKASLRIDSVGETGKEVLRQLTQGNGKIGGEAVLQIDSKHSIRFTFASPSTLMVHLPQATIQVVSIPHLSQLLVDEIERSMLGRICEIGVEVCQSISGTWFVDDMMCRAVGRWEGCVLNFRVKCTDDLAVDCHAYQLLRMKAHPSDSSISPAPKLLTYGSREDSTLGLFDWIHRIIEDTLASS